jgi:hypothetical protein
LRPPDQLKPEEQTALQQILDEDAQLAAGYRLLQRFRELIVERDVAALDTWRQDAQASNLPPFAGLANGIVKDRAAVEAALTMRWSTSMVEGHVNRVKLIKRQGYGRSIMWNPGQSQAEDIVMPAPAEGVACYAGTVHGRFLAGSGHESTGGRHQAALLFPRGTTPARRAGFERDGGPATGALLCAGAE